MALQGRDEQLARLRRLAERALAVWGLGGAGLVLLEHKLNTTFRVEAGAAGRFLLRLGKGGRYAVEEVRSELQLLAALAAAGLGVQEPMAAAGDGAALVVPLAAEGEPEPRCCVLLRWLPGERLEAALDPRQELVVAGRTGELLARIHLHGAAWTPPTGFARPRWDLDRLIGAGAVLPGDLPADAAALLSRADRALIEEAARTVRAAVASLGDGPAAWGLIHADLEPDNLLLDGDDLYAIDFENCGWGHLPYDVAAALLPLADRRDFPARRAALLAGYRRVRPLPPEQERLLDAFLIVRCLFSLRLHFLDMWSHPATREEAVRLVPYMLGGIRRLLGERAGPAVTAAPATLTTVQLLSRLRALGIRLWAEGEKLQWSAPKGALTADLKTELAARKAEVLAFLAQAARAAQSSLPPLLPRPAAERAAPQPLSFAQQRLWFIDQLDPGSAAYNVAIAVRVEGAVAPGLLARCLDAVVARHEALRTTFAAAADGAPLQVIGPSAAAAFAVVDLAALPDGTRDGEAQRLAAAAAVRPFDLAAGPLLRSHLVALGAGEALLLFAMHHVVSDAWSGGVLVREVAALYEAFARGAASPLPPLPVQYADYARWQREWLAGEVRRAQVAYWREQLAGAPPHLELATDRPRPSAQDSAGRRRLLLLARPLADRLAALARQEGATLFMALLAGFDALLARYSGQTDVAVGAPVAGRNVKEVEELIGFFVNTLVLRADLAGDPTVRDLLARTRRTTLGAFAHQDLPFEVLVEELQPRRDLRYTPLFQVIFALQNVPGAALRLPGLVLRRLPSANETSPFDLALTLEETAGGLRGSLRSRRDLFDATTIERLVGHFAALLAAMAADPGRRLGELPLLSPAEMQQLAEWNDTDRAADAVPVHERVLAWATAAPAAPAVVAGEEALTYGELARRAGRLARRLAALGVGPETTVAVCLERSPREVVALLAVLAAGGAYVPLDPAWPAERLRCLAADSGARALLTAAPWSDLFAGCELPLLRIDEEDGGLLPGGGKLRPYPGADSGGVPGMDLGPVARVLPGNLAYVVYTSGSTGRPKGVAVEHASLANLVAWHRRAFALAPGDRTTRLAGPAFDAAAWEIWPTLAAGATLVVPDAETRSAPESLRDWLVAERIAVAFAPTPLAEALLALDWPAGAALRALLTGGDRLHRPPPPGLPFVLVNDYGPTEGTVVATSGVIPPGDTAAEPARPPAIGRPIDNVAVHLLDAAPRPVPAGVAGEVWIGGAGLARGYAGRPELTAERFLPDPFAGLLGEPGARLYRTGDRARRLPDGDLEFLGRADAQVKIRGFRIEPAEVEARLAAHPEVAAAAVVARDAAAAGGAGDRRLVAYLVPRRPADAPGAVELRRFLAAALPEAMVPATFVVLAALPLTASGKVDRRRLPAPEDAEGTAAAGEVYAPPRNAVERAIAEIWQEVLRRERVGRNDSFFDLGGHSLTLVQVRARLAERFGRKLPMLDLFRHPTIAALADHLGGGGEDLATELARHDRGDKLRAGRDRLQQRMVRRR
jgi:amino acid adenylation domain-containing protein